MYGGMAAGKAAAPGARQVPRHHAYVPSMPVVAGARGPGKGPDEYTFMQSNSCTMQNMQSHSMQMHSMQRIQQRDSTCSCNRHSRPAIGTHGLDATTRQTPIRYKRHIASGQCIGTREVIKSGASDSPTTHEWRATAGLTILAPRPLAGPDQMPMTAMHPVGSPLWYA